MWSLDRGCCINWPIVAGIGAALRLTLRLRRPSFTHAGARLRSDATSHIWHLWQRCLWFSILSGKKNSGSFHLLCVHLSKSHHRKCSPSTANTPPMLARRRFPSGLHMPQINGEAASVCPFLLYLSLLRPRTPSSLALLLRDKSQITRHDDNCANDAAQRSHHASEPSCSSGHEPGRHGAAPSSGPGPHERACQASQQKADR